jgi:dTDP-4-dehydrorhamnose reductase
VTSLAPPSPLEVWGGIECTRNRVRGRVFDQLDRTGHAGRLSDLDLVAGLGVRALRYPVLWERTAPHGLGAADWRWPDERLGRLRELGIRPVVGLLHHGTGPEGTDLLDPRFAERFAEYAGAVAARWPWVDAYAPINEPLTTARFSGLYGVWHPHARDGAVFARILLNQCRATVLAMRAIRAVNPAAALIVNEDVGTILGTPALAHQAAFENERRWLTFDLACGRLGPDRPLWGYLRAQGVSEEELSWFFENPCVPDLLGVDHYITSDRILDERFHRYPDWSHSGNGSQAYADVEAVRVTARPAPGIEGALRACWDRYALPMAITEAHLGSTRDEQVRWLEEFWGVAHALRAEGIDVRALTVWSLFGAYEWNSLVTREAGFYEAGAFDLRGGGPRPTAVAGAVRDLASGHAPRHPVAGSPGWWRRPVRLTYPPVRVVAPVATSFEPPAGDSAPPLLAVGADGMLERALARICDLRGLRLIRVDRGSPGLEERLDRIRPWAVVTTIRCPGADLPGPARDECGSGTAAPHGRLAAACRAAGIPHLAFSSHLVFDGRTDRPYVETDPIHVGLAACPANADAERALGAGLVVRSGPLFGPWDAASFATSTPAALAALAALAAGAPSAADVVVSPSYLPDVLNAALDLLIDGERGIWHLANRPALAWAEFAHLVGVAAGVSVPQAGRPEGGRGVFFGLASERAELLPTLEDALARYLTDRERAGIEEMGDGPEPVRRARMPARATSSGPEFLAPASVPTSSLSEAPTP